MTRPVLGTENSRSALMTAINHTDDAPPKHFPQFAGAFICTLSAVCLGMVFTWTSSALPILEQEIGISKNQGAWIGSLVTLGAFFGAIPAGSLAHICGGKRFLQIIIVPLFLSWILIAFFYKYILIMYAARFVAGLAGGAISVAAPMFVSELAHISIRGTLGTFFQVQITIGILLGYILGDFIMDVCTLSLVSSVFNIIFLLSFTFIPESPVYYCSRKNMDKARKSLEWFRGHHYDIETELINIKDNLEEAEKNKAKLSDLINCKVTYKALIISIGLMCFQQLCGINAVIFYTNDIFQQSGSLLSPGACSILVGVVQVIATLGSTILIDKAGRKALLIISEFVMCLALAILGFYFYISKFKDLSYYSYLPLISVALYIIFFSIGLGPIPWMIMGEIFPRRLKGEASSVSAAVNWFLAFMVTNQFSHMEECFGIGVTFLIFSVICGVGTTFITFLVPETKGRSIDEIAHILLGNKQTENDDEKLDKVSTLV